MRVVWIVFAVCVLQCSAMTRRELEEFTDYLFQSSQMDINVKKGTGINGDFDEDEPISEHAWEDSGKFEGDLILNDRQRRLIVENVEGLSRNGLTDSTKRWPNNELVYFIQREHFNNDQVESIERGIEDLAQASCVKFRPYRKGDRDAVVIQGSRRGCFAQVGYQGGFQVLNLSGRHPAGRGCFRHGTVVHELLHTLGFYHMQSSPDRDDFIAVKWENILQPTRHNFRKYNSFSVSDFGVGYDYDSVLHYSRKAFSANGKDTLVPKQSGVSIGQRLGLSDKDTQKLNKMYCDSNSNLLEFDDGAAIQKPKKKKKPKNQPFEGHGIGYQKGKTVAIKLPAMDDGKLPEISTIEDGRYDFEVRPVTFNTPHSMQGQVLYRGVASQSPEQKPKQQDIEYIADDNEKYDEFGGDKETAQWETPRFPESKPSEHETFAESYEKLAKKVYSALDKHYPTYKSDHTEYYNQPAYKSDEWASTEHEHPDTPRRNQNVEEKSEEEHKPIESLIPHILKNPNSSYKPGHTIKNVYTIYKHPESPKLTIKYMKDRRRRINEQNNERNYPRSLYSPELVHRHNSENYSPIRGNIMEHKSGYMHFAEPESNRGTAEKFFKDLTKVPFYGDTLILNRESKSMKNDHVSEEYEDSSETLRKSAPYSVFESPMPYADEWYL